MSYAGRIRFGELNRHRAAKFAVLHGLRPGDRLKIPIFWTGITMHHVIYLGMDEQGNEWLSENHKFENVRLVRATYFFNKYKQFDVIPFKGTDLMRKAAVQRALAALGQPYDLIRFNCEHYANYVQTGVSKSDQVDNARELVGLAAIFFAAIGFFAAFTKN